MFVKQKKKCLKIRYLHLREQKGKYFEITDIELQYRSN